MRGRDLPSAGYIKNTMTEGTKYDTGVAYGGLVGEHHLQHGEVTDDWGGDRGDHEEHGSCEEQEGPEVVEDASLRHCEDCVVV